MNTNFTILILCLCFCTLSGQQTNIDMCDIIRHSIITKSSDTITSLLQSDPNKLTDQQKADLYSIRGRMNIKLNRKENNDKKQIVLKEAYNDLTKAVNSLPNEADKLKYIARRYFLFENHESHYKDYQSDLKKLNAKGLRQDKTGIGASVVTRFDGDFWIGADISLFSGYAPTYKVVDENNEIVLRKKNSISASAFIFGFSRNTEIALNDYNFSLVRIEAPLFIDLLKIGYIEAPGGKNHWYYRPEIGVGYSLFHLSGGYNIFFKGEGSEALSNLSLNFRIKYTF